MLGFGCVSEWRSPVDRICVATAVALSAQVTALLEVGNDLLDGALSDPDLLCDVVHAHARIPRYAEEHPRVVGQERPRVAHTDMVTRDLTHEKISV